jgi:solute carrier family 25 carnitine/acylcarnitine transporter 20/29
MNEYLSGNLFGISQIIVGHPFDTIKINIQSSNIQSFKDITKYIKNPKILYRGISYPLLMNCIGTSCLFGNYNYFYKETNNRLLSGMLSGMISAVILTPFDYKKMQLQIINNTTNTNMSINKTKDTHTNKYISCIKKYYSGFPYTLSRETIAIPIYFYTYHYLKDITNPFISGGLAGVNSWLCTYPIDTLKTRKQLYQQKTLVELIKLGSLYKGLSITLLRAFIVNGTSFYIYEFIKKQYAK